MKYGWLVGNGSLHASKYNEMHQMYVESAKRLNIQLEIVDNSDIMVLFQEGNIELIHNYQNPDFVLYLDKDLGLAKALESSGIPIFNSSRVIDICDSKIKTHQFFNDLPSPKTILSPCIFKGSLANSPFLKEVVNQLGYPMVVKEEFGSFGQQVYLVHNDDELNQLEIKLGIKSHLFQECIMNSYGKDVRIQMIGNRIVSSVMRYSENDFRSNVTLGGNMCEISLDDDFKYFAYLIQDRLQASFCGIDLLFGKDGPLLCEVNSNAHVKNLSQTTHINVCDLIMEDIYDKIYSQRLYII